VVEIRAGVTVNRTRQSVSRNGTEVLLSPQLFSILLLIANARDGTTPARLFDAIYADSRNGGPLTGRKAMQVQRVNLNRRLAPLALRVTSGGAGAQAASIHWRARHERGRSHLHREGDEMHSAATAKSWRAKRGGKGSLRGSAC
jgi:hypothetical protein